MIGALRPRSTQSGQLEAENHQEQSTGVREAAENLLEIESTISARAAPEYPSGPFPCPWSASRARGHSCTCVPLLGLPPVHVVVMRAFEQFGGGGSRTCACCELQPCGIRARGPCGLGSRSTHARELACVHEIACHVVPPRVWSAYFLNGLCEAYHGSSVESGNDLGRFGCPRHMF